MNFEEDYNYCVYYHSTGEFLSLEGWTLDASKVAFVDILTAQEIVYLNKERSKEEVAIITRAEAEVRGIIES